MSVVRMDSVYISCGHQFFLLVSTEEFHDVAPHFREHPVCSGILRHVPYGPSDGSLLIEWIDALPAKW